MLQRYICFLLLSSILLSSCATRKYSDRYREGDNSGQNAALTVEEEKKLTKEALPSMEKDYPRAQNPRLQAYIENLGQKLVRANNLHNNPYTYSFTVVDAAAVNAFALPAGTIYITAPIIAMADSEAEIAGVLGHEIGHVTARHTAERMYAAKAEQGSGYLKAGVGAVLGGAAGFWLGKKMCKPNDKGCQAKFALYGAGGGAGAGLLVHNYGFMKNGREDELESDRVGFKYAVNAGYNKDKVGDFYMKLMKMEADSKGGSSNPLMGWMADAMSTHPASKDRVSQANELKAKLQNRSNATENSQDFFEMRTIARGMVEATAKKSKSR